MHFLIVTGMSGAGKTVAIRYLEDLGALCVDNLPPVMLVPFMEACRNVKNPVVAVAADIRSGEFFDARAVTKMIDEARMVGFTIDTLFIEADDQTLVNRYKESRREHPLSADGLTLEQAIREERERLMPLRETATHLVDTTSLKPRALQKILRAVVLSADEQPSLNVEVLSFGFKRGIPREADLMFDVRFLPNPFYIPELSQHTGQDADVRDFVMEHPVTRTFMAKAMDMLGFLLPNYITEGKHRLVIAIGCTGGCHRSVAIAEAISRQLGEMGYKAGVTHRDMAMEQAHVKARSEYQKGEP
ncbi:MAG: RNase adapter RapZ [Clostridia bacterium]|nr:RNase adapter RapZ [Clostridia bacterium]